MNNSDNSGSVTVSVDVVPAATYGWHHVDLSAMIGAPGAAGDPWGYQYKFNAQGTQHVVYRGGDGHIHELCLLDNGWVHTDLSPMTGAPGAAGDPMGYLFIAEGTQHVVYRGGDGHIHELYWVRGYGWRHGDLSAATGAPGAASDPSGYPCDAQGSKHVNYRGGDGHIHELWWNAASGWHYVDRSAETGAPGAAGDPFGYQYNYQGHGTQHVHYRSNDGHIHELWWCLGVGWQHVDLSASYGAPGAAGDPKGYQFIAQGSQHVVYRGGDGHIYELWCDVNGSRRLVDLSAGIGAPSAASDPSGYTFEAQGTRHVVYRDGDGHIHELWWNAAEGWHHNDLSAITGAPGAAGDPMGYMFDVNGTQHVVYRGGDGHIHELRWDPAPTK